MPDNRTLEIETMGEPHYNNIFNKKNIEFKLDGQNKSLPYGRGSESEVNLKANQIIFTSINNIFQKLLDNDLYNEALLRKYIESGYLGGPTYVSSVNAVADNPLLNKKFVVSGADGISVLRKEEVPVIETLSGRYLDGMKVNKATFFNDRFIACTDNGIYESANEEDWTKRIGEPSIDVVDMCYNQNFLNDSLLSAYDYLAIANSKVSSAIYGHNGIEGTWNNVSEKELSSTHIDASYKPYKIFTFKDDSNLYLGTQKGLLASTFRRGDYSFKTEIGTESWRVYDMAKVPETDEKPGSYLLATNYGLKQSRDEYGFNRFEQVGTTNFISYDVLNLNGGTFYLATSNGLLLNAKYKISGFEKNTIFSIASTSSGKIYAGSIDGIYRVNDTSAIKLVPCGNVRYISTIGDTIFAYSQDNKNLYYTNSSNDTAWQTFNIGLEEKEIVKQLIANNIYLYIVTNKRIIALRNNDEIQNKFIQQYSLNNIDVSSGISFAQNLSDGETIVQIGSRVYVFKEDGSKISAVFLPTIKAAVKNLNDYWLLTDGGIYLLFQEDPTIDSAEISQKFSSDGIKAIAWYQKSSTENGLVFVDKNYCLQFLPYDSVRGILSRTPEKIKDDFKDVAVVGNGIYGIDKNGSKISKFLFSSILGVKNEIDVEDIVSIEQFGLPPKQSYLSVFSNEARLSPYYLTSEVKIAGNNIQDADYIDYANTIDKNNLFLIGDDDGVGIQQLNESGLTGDIVRKSSVGKPKAFADAYYYNNALSLVNGINLAATDSGLYVLSTVYMLDKKFREPNAGKVNGFLNTGSRRFIATDTGVWEYDDLLSGKFARMNFEFPVHNLSIKDNIIMGGTNGDYGMLISSDITKLSDSWTSLYPNLDSKDFYTSGLVDVQTIDGEEGRDLGYFPITADSSFFLSIDETILSGNDLTEIFNGLQELTAANDEKILAIYGKDEQLKANCVDGNAYNLNSDGTIDYDSESEAIPLQTILEDGYANSINVDEHAALCSITDGAVLSISVPMSYKANITSAFIDEASINISSKKKELLYTPINIEVEQGYLDSTLSASDFSLSIIKMDREDAYTPKLISIELDISGDFAWNTIEQTDTGIVRIRQTESKSFISVITQELIGYQRYRFSFSEYFNKNLSSYSLDANGNGMTISCFATAKSISAIKCCMNYSISNTCSISKQLPIIATSEDGINLNGAIIDDRSASEPQTDIDQESDDSDIGPDPGSASGPKTVYGFCAEANGAKYFFDGTKLYSFDSFITHRRNSDIVLFNASKTHSNPSFNDLYYYRTPEPYSINPIRKTKISTHERSFLVSKNDTTPGDISRISKEGNYIYALKNRNVYYTSSSLFPKTFNRITGISNVKYLESCPSYTLVVNQSNTLYKIEKGIRQSAIHVSSNVLNLFSSYETIYIQCEDRKIYFLDESNRLQEAVSIPDIYQDEIAKGFFEIENDAPVLITEDEIYCGEKFFDLNNEYSKINQATNIVDLQSIDSSVESSQRILIATDTQISVCTIGDLDSQNPSIHFSEIDCGALNLGSGNKIKAICYDNGSLYVLHGSSIAVVSDYKIGDPIVQSFAIEDAIDGNSSASMKSFPYIVQKNKIKELGLVRRIVQDDEKSFPGLKAFVKNLHPFEESIAYAYSDKDLIEIKQKAVGINAAYLYRFEESILSNGVKCISTNGQSPTLLYFKDGKIWEKNGDSEIEAEVEPNNVSISQIFYANDSIKAIDSTGKLYGPFTGNGLTIDGNNTIARDSLTLVDSEMLALGFFNNVEYIFSYAAKQEDNSIKTRFKSSNESIGNYMNGYGFEYPVFNLTEFFNRYLLAANQQEILVYDLRRRTAKPLSYSQFAQIAKGYSSLSMLKDSNGTGFVGYGPITAKFNDFEYMVGYGPIPKESIALANNFKRGTRLIEVVNSVPDFLIGTTYGLKYVYDEIMTRSFIDRDNRTSINGEVTAIEKVNAPENTYGFYVAACGNVLYEISNLSALKFKKLLELDPSETISDIFSLQKNEYIISTSKGIYLTSLKYELINDLQRFTVNSIYEIINDELKSIIADHIASYHRPKDLITKINKKASNKLSFISNEDLHRESYDYSPVNGVRVVKDDIIESIVRGGEDPEADTYVKVGLRSWALNNMQSSASYQTDGFVTTFVDPTSGKTFDVSRVPYIVKNWKSGLKEIYIYVPTTGTYYANNPRGISNSKYANSEYERANVPGSSLLNSLPEACTTLRVYLYNSYFNIKTILAAQCTGNSLPLKIYKDKVNAEEGWEGVFDTVMQPSALRTLPTASSTDVNNVRSCTDELGRIYLDFSIYGTDAQAIRIIAES